MSKKRNAGVKKCLNRFSSISDEIEMMLLDLPKIARVSLKDIAREISFKQKTDYTSTYSLVSVYCRLRAADGKISLARGEVRGHK